jgi:hypothetical protein
MPNLSILRHPDSLVDYLFYVNVGSHVERVSRGSELLKSLPTGDQPAWGWYLAKRHKKIHEIML